MKSPLIKVLDIAGTQTALAAKIGTGQATVSAWVNRYDNTVGADYVIKVSEAVEWKVTPHQLRPDIYPHPDDGLPTEMRCKCEKAA
jgi:DNA-binding transcriptional regulator YdaS (Cro superfamily)